jgi:hypothetical protein
VEGRKKGGGKGCNGRKGGRKYGEGREGGRKEGGMPGKEQRKEDEEGRNKGRKMAAV